MNRWAGDFDSWDVCDQVCGNLFDRTPYAWAKASEWVNSNEEFVRRAGFTLMACLAVHDKQAADEPFLVYLQIIRCNAADPRNFVKKAVNWALRQIGKRSAALLPEALLVARELAGSRDPASRWIGRGALREFNA